LACQLFPGTMVCDLQQKKGVNEFGTRSGVQLKGAIVSDNCGRSLHRFTFEALLLSRVLILSPAEEKQPSQMCNYDGIDR
jgi:hypothetical protein